MDNLMRRITSIALAIMITLAAMPAGLSVHADDGAADGSEAAQVEEQTESTDKSGVSTDSKTEAVTNSESVQETADSNNEQNNEPGSADEDNSANPDSDTASRTDTGTGIDESVDDQTGDEEQIDEEYKISRVSAGKISYTFWDGKEYTTDLYAAKIPAGAKNPYVDFGTSKYIAYGYSSTDMSASDSYLNSCSADAAEGYAGWGTVGESKAYIRKTGGSYPAYIIVQTPYDNNYSSDVLYIIKIEGVGASDDSTSTDDSQSDSDSTKLDVTESITSTREYVESTTTNAYGEERYSIGLARDGYPVSDDYYKNVYEQVAENKGNMETSTLSYTNNAKTILALTAGGYDATNIAGYNLVAKLSDYDAIVAQGINGPVWALLALDSHNYEIPTANEGTTQATRENLVKEILDKTIIVTGDDGVTSTGWGYYGTTPDVDMTAMTITALAPYREDKEVAKVLDAAIEYLKSQYPYDNADSAAWAIIGITALGINPAEFIEGNETALIDNLNESRLSGGNYTFGSSESKLATEDAYLALVALSRANSNYKSLFDMTDIETLKLLTENGTASEDSTVTPGVNPVKEDEDSNKDTDTTKKYSEDFTVSTGTILSETNQIVNLDWQGTPQSQVNLYTIKVPASAETIIVDFGGQELIAYGYDSDNQTYLISCSADEENGYAGWGAVGETKAYIRKVNGSFPTYIRVQTPYDSSFSSTDLYVIKVVATDDSSDTTSDNTDGNKSSDSSNSTASSTTDSSSSKRNIKLVQGNAGMPIGTAKKMLSDGNELTSNSDDAVSTATANLDSVEEAAATESAEVNMYKVAFFALCGLNLLILALVLLRMLTKNSNEN